MAGGGKSIDQLVDLLAFTQEKVFPFRDDDFAQTIHEFHVISDWMNSKKIEVQSGSSIEHPVTLEDNPSTGLVEMYEPIAIGMHEKRVRLVFPWTMANFHFLFEEREKLINRRGSQIRDAVRARRRDAYYAFCRRLETWGFGIPASADDTKTPLGLRSHILPDIGAVAGTRGFNGDTLVYGDGTSTNIVGGRNRTTDPNLKNYTNVYEGDIDNGWVKSVMRRTYHDTSFRAPKRVPGMKDEMLNQVMIYCGLETIESLEDLVEAQQGARKSLDLTAVDDSPRYRKLPFVRAEPLDDIAHQPIIGCNHRHFKAIVMDGEWLNEQKPMKAGVERHRTVVTHVDSQFNFVGKMPRHQGFYLHRYIAA